MTIEKQTAPTGRAEDDVRASIFEARASEKINLRAYDKIVFSRPKQAEVIVGGDRPIGLLIQHAADFPSESIHPAGPDDVVVLPLSTLRFEQNPLGMQGSHLRRGTMAVLPRETDYRCICPKGTPDLLFMQVGPDGLARAVGDDIAAAPLAPRWNVGDPILAGLIDQLVREHLAGAKGSCVAVESYALLILLHILRTWCDAGEASGPGTALTPARLRRVCAYIEDNLERDFGVSDLAACAGLSPAHFARGFKAATGLPPHKYVLRARIRRACAMLEASSEPIAEIALACGFSSQSHLTDVFGVQMGTTPARYRRDRQE